MGSVSVLSKQGSHYRFILSIKYNSIINNKSQSFQSKEAIIDPSRIPDPEKEIGIVSQSFQSKEAIIDHHPRCA
jgi:hypothetical protein